MRATHEHEWEAAPGLPSALPAGERVVWQGAPNWKRLAIHAFHVRKVALYFAFMLAVQAINLTAPEGQVDWKPLVVAGSLYALALALLLGTAWFFCTQHALHPDQQTGGDAHRHRADLDLQPALQAHRGRLPQNPRRRHR